MDFMSKLVIPMHFFTVLWMVQTGDFIHNTKWFYKEKLENKVFNMSWEESKYPYGNRDEL